MRRVTVAAILLLAFIVYYNHGFAFNWQDININYGGYNNGDNYNHYNDDNYNNHDDDDNYNYRDDDDNYNHYDDDDSSEIPLDGGLGFLAAAGAGLGIKKLRDNRARRKKTNVDNSDEGLENHI